jgi:RNA polymerase sigma-70 factor (ECF subfamily)
MACLTRYEDDGLLLAAAVGDADAFDAFHRRHMAAVAGFLLRRGGPAELREELAAETFAAALLGCPQYRPGEQPARTWLLQIAERKLKESRRCGRVSSTARRQLALERIALAGGAPCRAERPEVLDPGAAILHVVDELDGDQRDAVIARVVEERDYADIASELACPEAVVRSHVSHGLARLRERLAIAQA